MKINNNDELIRKFAEKLIEDRGGVLEEEKEAEIGRIIDEIDDLLIDEVVDSLPEEKQRALDKLAEENEELPEEALNAIILGAGLDYSEISKKVLGGYREKYLGEEA